MSKISGWGILEQSLEEERNFYLDVTVPTGIVWDRTWLEGYKNDDRGYSISHDLLNLYVGTEDSEDNRGIFKRLLRLTSSSITEIPAMEKELRVMRDLYETHIKPTKDIIFSKVPEAVAERGKLEFVPEEYAQISDSLSRLRVYMDYRNGINGLRYHHFVKKEPCFFITKTYQDVINAFLRKWNEKFYLGNVEQFGFVTFCAIDSHNNSILPRVLESELVGESPDKILLSDIPETGISRVILDSNIEKIREKMRVALLYRKHGDIMCNVNNLRIRLERKEFERRQQKVTRLTNEVIHKYSMGEIDLPIPSHVKTKLAILIDKERKRNSYTA